MNRPPHIRAALSAAGAAFAKHVRETDVYFSGELAPSMVEEINWTLRGRGLVLRPTDSGDGWVANLLSLQEPKPIAIPARIFDALSTAIGLVEAGGTGEFVGKHHPTTKDEKRFEAVLDAKAWLEKQKRDER